jgi:3-oxoacyl-[acyl-carrier protein] reductase
VRRGKAYALTKAAFSGFTHGLARDLAPRRSTVNNIEPGPVDTELGPADGPSADFLRGLMAITRYGTVEEIASRVAYLASAAAAYIITISIPVDGGFAA